MSLHAESASAEGSSSEQNGRKGIARCDDRLLALYDCSGLVEMRGCGLGKTK